MPNWVRIANLPNGKRRRTRLYEVWSSMRKRCLCQNVPDYPRYGRRGITICAEWLADFGEFRSWALTNGYRKGLTIDRKDSNGHYTPGNCRWIPKSDQQLNTRQVVMLTVRGETKPLPIWAREFGIKSDYIRSRIRSGWSHERAVTTPVGRRRQLQLPR